MNNNIAQDDVEKRAGAQDDSLSSTSNTPPDSQDAYDTCDDEPYDNSTFARLQRLGTKLGVEARGIERVPEEERTDTSYWNIGSMWLAANMVVPSFTIGVLGQPLFGVGFADSALIIIFFNLLGSATVCFFSTFGVAFGLRQMVLSRFWFGWWGVKIIAVFNLCACLGWAAANIIVGAQLLNAVNEDVPGYAGILIIALCTLGIVFFGYKVVHAYEYWSWIPTFIVFLITLGVFAHSGAFVNIPMRVGSTELGAVLSYGSTVFGFGTGYTSFAADFTVYQPSNRPRRRVFLATWLGIFPTLLFTELLGAAIVTATTINGGDNQYQRGYTQAGVGGLLGAVLFEPLGGFGKFCVVILALSIVANNCPNIYSVPLTLMTLGRWTRKVPRFVWSTIGTAIYIGIAIPGYSSFESTLENFMNFIGYWLAIYETISLTEHFVFRRGFSGYNPEDYDDASKLPPGIASTISFCMGIGGMVLGMSKSWFIGPIAKKAGAPPFGGDIGFELAAAFALVTYLVTRTIEKRYFKR